MSPALQLWVRYRPEHDVLASLPNVRLNLLNDAGPLPEAVRHAEFLVPPFNRQDLLELLGQMPSLRVVQAASAGVDWLLPWVPPGVTVCSARGLRDSAVAEWALAVILADAKRLPDVAEAHRVRDWKPWLVGELGGKRALIVGYGSIGRAIETRLVGFGVTVDRVASRRRAGVHTLGELSLLLPEADIVILALPHAPATAGLFGPQRLDELKHGALLVNAGRGTLVQTDALLSRLQDGRLRAALDVTDPEPLPGDHPLWTAPGLILTPHMAGDTHEAEERIYRFVGAQVRRHLSGEQLRNVVSG